MIDLIWFAHPNTVHPNFFWKSHYRDMSWPKTITHRGNFWSGFGTFESTGLRVTPISIQGYRQGPFLILAINHPNRGLAENAQSPKQCCIMAAKTRCPNMCKYVEWFRTVPNMDASAIFCLILALKCLIFDGTFFIWLVCTSYIL